MVPIPYVTVSRFVAAPPEAVWEVLVGTRHWPTWGASISAVDPADGRIALGSSGSVRTALGMWLPFRVTSFKEVREWSWNVAGLPATRHRVKPQEAGCRVSFDVPVVAWPYLLVCRDALRRIAQIPWDA